MRFFQGRPALGLALMLGSLLAGCQAAEEDLPQRPERSANVGVYSLRPDTLVQYAFLPVTAMPWRQVGLAFQEGGTIEEIAVDLNDPVAAGQVLARLDADLLQAAAIETRADLDLQQYNYQRAVQLHGEGSLAESELKNAAYQLKRAQASQATLAKRLQNAVLRAPFSGRIAARLIEKGQQVQAGAAAFQLVQTQRVKVVGWVPENQIADFAQGTSVEIGFNAYPEEVHTAAVDRLAPAADPSRRVFGLEIHLDNSNQRIRAGMIGRMRAVRRSYRDVVVVPRQAVQERDAGAVVFAVVEDQAQRRPVLLGPGEGDRVIVETGLQWDERIVVTGGRDLIDGDRVRIMEDGAP
ncbi:MAG: efflux RND transporter periplasmic adaptor subunit [Candidatus Latescibacteria bacterium]|nr:efflux RND transporter periplasmic adaptor subunit [Candidatus Latescibacterota bacterium]